MDHFASGKDNFSVPQAIALALNHNKVTHRHQSDFLPARRVADKFLSILNRVNALVIIRIIEPQYHPHELLRRLQNHPVLPEKQF
jgi:hypothetical protein